MRTLTGLFALLLVAAFAGCADDSVAPPADSTTLIQGEIGETDFELTIDAAGTPTRPFEGPFVLRGSNLHYDDAQHALVVDLTIANRGIVAHPEPIGLTFLSLRPAGTTVQNPDNDIHGDGAAIVFAFANDDALWTPRETSLPRTVRFDVAPGTAVAFTARLDISTAPTGDGRIAGRVFVDLNLDGIPDSDGGVPDIAIWLRSISADDSSQTLAGWYTVTGPDGRYEFTGLSAGTYTVHKITATFPTTPTEITVLLTEFDGHVTQYDGADFGCRPVDVPPPPGGIEVGSYVQVKGKYYESDVFVALAVEQLACPADTMPSGAVIGGCSGGTLRGPVTGHGRDQPAFRLMSAWIQTDSVRVPFEIHVGSRLEVQVRRMRMTGAWAAESVAMWDGAHDELVGRVDDVERSPDGGLRFRVLDTWIRMSNF